jgi:hypothetical protein
LARREASEAQHREEEAYAKIAELTERLRALQYSGPWDYSTTSSR